MASLYFNDPDKNSLEFITELTDEPMEPIVHTWLPAASLYFKDPDDHLLEYISLLNGEPSEHSTPPYYSEWLEMKKK